MKVSPYHTTSEEYPPIGTSITTTTTASTVEISSHSIACLARVIAHGAMNAFDLDDSKLGGHALRRPIFVKGAQRLGQP